MSATIHFTDISKPIHTVPVIIGVILCIGSGALIITRSDDVAASTASIIALLAALLGIVLIAIPQILNIRKSDTIRYNKRGLTAKLLGRKTFGFEYRNVTSVILNDQLLQIEVLEMDLITLSRKRYNQNSLLQIKQLIELHKTQS